jgi:hypothetical protein
MLLITRLATLLTLLLGATWVWAENLDQPPLCEAEVFSDRAEFSFPILDVDEWRWFRKETPKDQLEYAWEVMLPADKPGYVFGVYLAKRPGELQKNGSLDQLLEQTHWNAVLLVADEGGGVTPVALPKTQLSVELRDGGVVLTLLGAESLEKFFHGHPKQARFNLLHPDEVFSIDCLATIDYPSAGGEKGQPKQSPWPSSFTL